MGEPLNVLVDRVDSLRNDLENFTNPRNQHIETAQNVSSFVEKVFAHVSENPDIPAVNKILADSLLEIRRYVSNRSNEIEKMIALYNTKLVSYQECIELLLKHAGPTEANSVIDDIEISQNKSDIIEARITAQLDDEGNIPNRKMGGRPEKLREVRRVQEKLMEMDILEKDI